MAGFFLGVGLCAILLAAAIGLDGARRVLAVHGLWPRCRDDVGGVNTNNWVAIVIELGLAALPLGFVFGFSAVNRRQAAAPAREMRQIVPQTAVRGRLRSSKACARRQSTFGRGNAAVANSGVKKRSKVKDLARISHSRQQSCGLSDKRKDGP